MRRLRVLGTTSLLGSILACACGGDDAPAADAGRSGFDATVARDAGGPDAGESSRDAGETPRDAGGRDAGAGTDAGSSDAGVDGGPLTYASCYEDVFSGSSPIMVDYDSFMPTIGSHCLGTNHQAITGVERVVFLGDSVTVGTPPTLSADYYRSQLAERLATHFGIRAPDGLWRLVNPSSGTALVRESGDFATCAEWGARTDDLMMPQIADCFPEDTRDRTTLVVMTVGGNDISSITQDGIDGVPVDDIWMDVRAFVQLLEDAVAWFREPGRFPGGVYIVFANMYEFTDATGDVSACPAAGLAGFGAEWKDPTALADMVVWANEQYMRIAVESGSDMIFMLEEFCGHGYQRDNPMSPCYRGPGTELWFDLTCIHPNPAGHDAITDMFMAVVSE
jgi:lysophospholipase L1-like esterase